MKRGRLVCLLFGLCSTCSGLGFLFGRVAQYAWTPDVLIVRLSPDETTRIRLVNLAGFNPYDMLSIQLDRSIANDPTTVARLPNDWEGPAGTERFIWSRDGTRVLLVGRHFFIRDDLRLNTGEEAYFLYDLKSGRSWINSAEEVAADERMGQPRSDRLPPLTAAILAGVEFAEPVVIQPPTRVDPDSPRKPE